MRLGRVPRPSASGCKRSAVRSERWQRQRIERAQALIEDDEVGARHQRAPSRSGCAPAPADPAARGEARGGTERCYLDAKRCPACRDSTRPDQSPISPKEPVCRESPSESCRVVCSGEMILPRLSQTESVPRRCNRLPNQGLLMGPMGNARHVCSGSGRPLQRAPLRLGAKMAQVRAAASRSPGQQRLAGSPDEVRLSVAGQRRVCDALRQAVGFA